MVPSVLLLSGDLSVSAKENQIEKKTKLCISFCFLASFTSEMMALQSSFLVRKETNLSSRIFIEAMIIPHINMKNLWDKATKNEPSKICGRRL